MARFLIKDFQCIDKAVIEVEGLTVLHGDSSAGKSSIIKAIYSAINNRFRPTQVRHGSEQIKVNIQWESDGSILRVVRFLNGSPVMELKCGESISRFEKLNRSIPAEIEDFNKMGNLQVDNDIFSLNFFSQFQKPLLLEFSQKKVMQLMSSSTAFDDYNAARKQIETNRDKNKGSFQSLSSLKAEYSVTIENLNHEIEAQEHIVEELKKQYEIYQSIKSRIARLQSIKNLQNNLEFTQFSIKSIESIIKQYSAALDCLKHADMLELYLIGVNKIEAVNKKIEYFGNKIDALLAVNKSLIRRNKIKDLSQKAYDLSHLNHEISVADIMIDCRRSLQSAYAKVEKERTKCQRLRDLQRAKSSVATLQSRIIVIDSIINEHRCPLCGAKLQ